MFLPRKSSPGVSFAPHGLRYPEDVKGPTLGKKRLHNFYVWVYIDYSPLTKKLSFQSLCHLSYFHPGDAQVDNVPGRLCFASVGVAVPPKARAGLIR